jgi:hypothetical protein
VLARQAPGGGKGLAIIVATVALLSWTLLPPVVLILAAGVLGSLLTWQ